MASQALQENLDWDRLLCIMSGASDSDQSMTEADWMRLASLAQRLAIAPLLYDRLIKRNVDIPPRPLTILHSAYLHTAMRNTRVYHFLDEVLTALTDNNIPVIVMKGAYLAKGIYGNIAVRSMGDIDILVKTEHLVQTAKIMCDLGYNPLEPINHSTIQKCHHLPPFSKPNGVRIEVHGSGTFISHLIPMGQDELSNLWNRAKEVMLGGQSVFVFSPEDQLLYLCLHAAISHYFVVDLRPFFDIAEIICYYKQEIDWDIIASRAQEWKVENPVNMALFLAYTWAKADIPSDRIHGMPCEMTDSSMIEYIRKKVLNAPFEDLAISFHRTHHEDSSPLLTLNLSAFIGRHGYTFKSRPIIDGLFPPLKIMKQLYPAVGNSLLRARLYYTIRFCDLVKRYLKVIYFSLGRKLTTSSSIRIELALRRILFG